MSQKIINNKEIILNVENLSKIYSPDTPCQVKALLSINIQIYKGEYLAIVGPSGSGKSTLLQLMGCMDNATTGRIFLNGKEIQKNSEKELAQIRQKNIGFVFQSFYLLSSLTVLENILTPCIPFGITEKTHQYAKDLIKMAGLENRINHKIYQLSGGEQQRVCFCRALINKPTILLADEPTGNLDLENGNKIIEFLEKINSMNNVSVIIVTHNIEIAKRTNRIITLKNGEILN